MQRPEDLTAREGKILRYVVTAAEPVSVRMCVVRSETSDLPHTILQAARTLDRLRTIGMISRKERGYVATTSGRQLISGANRQNLWCTTD